MPYQASIFFVLVLWLFTPGCRQETGYRKPPVLTLPEGFDYPQLYRETPQFDTLPDGTLLANPYTWWESNDHRGALRNWQREQAGITEDILSQFSLPGELRKAIRREFFRPARSLPLRAGDHWYELEETGGGVVFMRSTAVGSRPDTVWQIKAALQRTLYFTVDPAERFISALLYSPGEKNARVYTFDLRNRRVLADSLTGVAPSRLAAIDNGFFYTRYLDAGESAPRYHFPRVYFHPFGADPANDDLFFTDPARAQQYITPGVIDEWLCLRIQYAPNQHRLLLRELNEEDFAFLTLPDTAGPLFSPVTTQGEQFYLRTHYQAPMGSLVAVHPDSLSPEHWTILLPEKRFPLHKAMAVPGGLLLIYQEAGFHKLYYWRGSETPLLDLPLPISGTLHDVQVDGADRRVFFRLSAFDQPARRYQLDLDRLRIIPLEDGPVKIVNAYQTQLVTYRTYDGQQVPMWLVSSKAIAQDGQSPVLIYTPGWEHSFATPNFQMPNWAALRLMVDQGGTIAIPLVRGMRGLGAYWAAGSEHAQADLLEAADFLVQKKYAHPDRLGLYGNNTGGWIAAGAMLMRPGRFSAVILEDGWLRLPGDRNSGMAWRYFPPPHEQNTRNTIWSPAQQVSAGNYPPCLVQVQPGNYQPPLRGALHFTAALQDAQRSNFPILLDERPATPLRQDHQLKFLLHYLGMEQ